MTDVMTVVLRETEQNKAYAESMHVFNPNRAPLAPFEQVLSNFVRDGFIIDHALLDKDDKLVVILVRGYATSVKRSFRGVIE